MQLGLFAEPEQQSPNPVKTIPAISTKQPEYHVFRKQDLSEILAKRYGLGGIPMATITQVILDDLAFHKPLLNQIQPLFNLLGYEVLSVETSGAASAITIQAYQAQLLIVLQVENAHYNAWVQWPTSPYPGHDIGPGNFWYSSLTHCLADCIAAIERFLPLYWHWLTQPINPDHPVRPPIPIQLGRGKQYNTTFVVHPPMTTPKDVLEHIQRNFEGEDYFLGAAIQKIPGKGLAVVVNFSRFIDCVIGDDISGVPIVVKVSGQAVDFKTAKKVMKRMPNYDVMFGLPKLMLTTNGPGILVEVYEHSPDIPTEIKGVPVQMFKAATETYE